MLILRASLRSRLANKTCVLLALLLSLQAGLLVWSAKVHSPTWDEPAHLAAGISHWQLGRFDLYSVNPPLVRMLASAAVLMVDAPEMDWALYSPTARHRSEVLLGRRMIELNGERTYRQFFLARLAVIPISLIGTLACFWIARRLFGQAAGFVAATLWAFSPTVLGYGSVITPDLASAVVALVLGIAIFHWLSNGTLRETMLLGGCMAIAMLTKSIWIFSPIAVFVGLIGWSLFAGRPFQWKGMVGSVGQLAIATVFALVLVNAFYGFSGSFQKLGSYQFVSSSLSGVSECAECSNETVGNRFSQTALAWLPVPLPRAYVEGIDVQRNDFEQGQNVPAWESYLNGQWKAGGWWYFYFIGLFHKETLLLWGLALLGTIAFLRFKQAAASNLLLYSIAIPALMVLFVISINTGLNRYIRYAVPVLPLLIIWASQAVRLLSWSPSESESRGYRRQELGAAAVAFAAMVVALLSGPHWLSYFNIASGGIREGHLRLCDSNVDWGQDVPAVRTWLEKHPEAKPNLHFAYFGSYDPVNLGVQYTAPAQLPAGNGGFDELRASARKIDEGWYIVSKNFVVGHQMPMPDGQSRLIFPTTHRNGLAYLRTLTPIDEIGGSMLVYKVDRPAIESISASIVKDLVPPVARTTNFGLQSVALGARPANKDSHVK